ncbi:MAG: hypothetical protein IKS48_09360 [Eubacterium sp.]|nr:hypothetical protein [Eubacterium sp.]
MKILNKKILILFSAVLLLGVAAFSAISLMFADDENGASEESVKLAASSVSDSKTIIDYIIDNSHNTDDGNDPVYHVLEIYSGSTPSSLKEMVEGGNFEKYVFDENKSAAQTLNFNSGKIDYTGYNLHEDDDTLVAAISKADLIYLSEDPSSLWSRTNDISETVKQALANYATGNDTKPLIIDSHNLTQELLVQGAQKVKDLCSTYYAREGNSYATFRWPHDMNLETLMNPADMTALYNAIDGDTQRNNGVWAEVSVDSSEGSEQHTGSDAATQTTPDKKEYIAKVLTIHNSGVAGDLFLTNQFRANFDGTYDFTGKTVNPDTFDTTKETLKLDPASALYKFGYAGRSYRPDAFQFESLDMNDPDQFNAIADIDYTQYDFVILEESTKDVEIGGTRGTEHDVYTSLLNAMYTGVHVLYDSNLAPDINNGGSIADLTADNIKYVYDKVATSTDVSRYEHVLVTTRVRMDVYATATSGAGVKDIADIINAGTFRGIGGSSDSSNKYTVLEIEPCYPINTTLARYLNPVKNYRAIGANNFLTVADRANAVNNQYGDSFYYLRTDGVLDKTSDEITYGDGKSLTTLLENTAQFNTYINQANIQNVNDYYDWSVSKAKIAHATGREYSQINVIHMSSMEFACSRKSLLDNYDAIYIGGNHTAIKDANKWYAKSKGGNVYTMYFHNGDIYDYTNAFNEKSGDYGVFSGNDLTANKLKELKDYAPKMPVILDTELCQAFKGAHDSGKNQELIDPQSNMYKFLEYVTDVDSTGSVNSKYPDTVLVNFESQYTNKTANNSSNGKPYGDTQEGFATVFKGNDTTDYTGAALEPNGNHVCEIQFAEKLNHAARPLLAVTQMPTIYNDMDESTWITYDSSHNEGLNWKVSVSTAATVNLYIDDDSNGRFTADEKIGTKTGKNVSFNFKPNSDYYGVVYWKVEAITASGLSSSTTNVCKIRRTTQSKMYINLLQIMPSGTETKYKTDGSNEATLKTLFLCTECQFAKSRLKGNRYTPVGMFYQGIMGGENTFYGGAPGGLTGTNEVVGYVHRFESGYQYEGSNLGSHMHDFGIVEYSSDISTAENDGSGIESKVGQDDISSNWFDIIKDDYDVDTTILYTDEYEAKVAEVNNYYSGMSDTDIDNGERGTRGFNEKKNKYYKLYQAMQAVLNGRVEGYSDTFVTYNSATDTVNINYSLINSTFSLTPNFQTQMNNAGITNAKLEAYAAASYRMDDLLLNHVDQFHPDKFYRTRNAKTGANVIASFADYAKDICDDTTLRDKRKYYDVFSNYNDIGNNKIPNAFFNYYYSWRDAKILENFFFEQYQDNLWYASYDSAKHRVKLSDVYDCITIGAAETFNKDDLNEAACDTLLDYISDEGNLILFHDSLTSDSAGTAVMSSKLSSAFGMNARHQKIVTTNTPKDNNVEVTIDGITINPKAAMTRTVQSRTMVVKQKYDTITPNADSIKIKLGDQTKTVPSVSNNDAGYDFTIRRTGSYPTNVTLQFADQWGNAQSLTMPIDPSADTITADVSMEYGNFNNNTIIRNQTSSGRNSDGRVKLKFRTMRREWDGSESQFAGSFRVKPSTGGNWITVNGGEETVLQFDHPTYTISDSTKKTGTISVPGLQTIDVKFVDNAGNPIVGETIDYSVNGHEGQATSDGSGIASFKRENYNVVGYDVESNTTTTLTGETDSQKLIVKVLDPNGNEIAGKTVYAKETTGVNESSNTDANGNAEFTYSNYTPASTANPAVVSEDSAKYPKSTYFMSDIVGEGNSGISLSSRMLSYKGKYITFDIGHFGSDNYQQHLMYKYTSFYQKAEETSNNLTRIGTKHMRNAIASGGNSLTLPTDKASRNNDGIITMYPFTITRDLQIAATAPGSYAVDVEDENLVVYYSLVGGTPGTSSSLFAADPMDGINNYFLYQYGSITYTGAGHGLVTGYGRENNDERKLFINCIVNAGKKSARGPSVTLHDLDTTMDLYEAGKANRNIIEFSGDDCDYYTEIEELSDFKGFDFFANIANTTKLGHVKIYWNVNHTADGSGGVYKYDEGTDKLIFDSDRYENTFDDGTIDIENSVVENVLKPIKAGLTESAGMKYRSDGVTPMIALSDDCFDSGAGSQYAYIVVQVEDANNPAGQASAILRIQYKPSLIDLN